MRTTRIFLSAWVLVFTLALPGLVLADLPAFVHLSEFQPPTAEDWIRLKLAEERRRECGSSHTCAKCAAPVCEVGPLVLWPEIVYFPCRVQACPSTSSTCVSHKVGLRGGYGIAFPGPYYIPNPAFSVEMTGRGRCAGAQENWQFPNNRVEWRLGVWE